MDAPGIFIRLTDVLFSPKFEPYVFGYLDDLIIVTETLEDHTKWVAFVLEAVLDAGPEFLAPTNVLSVTVIFWNGRMIL